MTTPEDLERFLHKRVGEVELIDAVRYHGRVWVVKAFTPWVGSGFYQGTMHELAEEFQVQRDEAAAGASALGCEGCAALIGGNGAGDAESCEECGATILRMPRGERGKISSRVAWAPGPADVEAAYQLIGPMALDDPIDSNEVLEQLIAGATFSYGAAGEVLGRLDPMARWSPPIEVAELLEALAERGFAWQAAEQGERAEWFSRSTSAGVRHIRLVPAGGGRWRGQGWDVELDLPFPATCQCTQGEEELCWRADELVDDAIFDQEVAEPFEGAMLVSMNGRGYGLCLGGRLESTGELDELLEVAANEAVRLGAWASQLHEQDVARGEY